MEKIDKDKLKAIKNPLVEAYDRLTGDRTASHIAGVTFRATKDRSVMARLRAADMMAEHCGYKTHVTSDDDRRVVVEVLTYGNQKKKG